jgi:hypothetical protein
VEAQQLDRLHAVWEKLAALEIALYDTVSDYPDMAMSRIPHVLDKIADGLLEAACGVSGVARDAESVKILATEQANKERCAATERDKLTDRLGEIMLASRKRSKGG